MAGLPTIVWGTGSRTCHGSSLIYTSTTQSSGFLLSIGDDMNSREIIQEYLLKTNAPKEIIRALKMVDEKLIQLEAANLSLLNELKSAKSRGYYEGIHSRPP